MKTAIAAASIALAMVFAVPATASAASIVAKVDISSQTMTVIQHGRVKYRWRVSTARAGKVTPTGAWTAKWLSKNHRSSRYNGAPMPYSIFYNGNFAVHGTNQVNRLGRPASAGCVRLDVKNAATLYSMAQREGLKNVRIVVHR
jgi:lipoprotein-anchoring transpeptidase ErfK/SrfK